MNAARFFLNLAGLPYSVSHYESEQGSAYLVSGLNEVKMVLKQHSEFSCPSHPYHYLHELLTQTGCKWLGIKPSLINSKEFINTVQDFFKKHSENLTSCKQSINSGIPLSDNFYHEIKSIFFAFSLKLLFDFDLGENATNIAHASDVIEDSRAKFGFESPPKKYKSLHAREKLAKQSFRQLAEDIQVHRGKNISNMQTHAIQETILNAAVPLAYTFIWAILLLGRNECTQNLIYSKILQQSSITTISREALLRGVCIAVIKETLRLYPPAWALSRTCTNIKSLDNCIIQPGDVVTISPYALHRMHLYWDQPDRFFPARFETNHSKKSAFMPFGAGGRVCPAAQWNELILVIAVECFIEKYSVSTTIFPHVKPLVALRPAMNFVMSVQPRVKL